VRVDGDEMKMAGSDPGHFLVDVSPEVVLAKARTHNHREKLFN
jgi:hypothetical protein